MLSKETCDELAGQIIDIFEDFLTEKGIAQPDTAYIKDADYDSIARRLEGMFAEWNLAE